MFSLKVTLNRRPKYSNGSEDCLQPNISSNSCILCIYQIGTNFDFPKLIYIPDTSSNLESIPCNTAIWLVSVSQKIRVSSSNKRWDTIIKELAESPIEKPKNYPVAAATSKIWLKASMTISKSNGKRIPLTNSPRAIEYFTVKTQNIMICLTETTVWFSWVLYQNLWWVFLL